MIQLKQFLQITNNLFLKNVAFCLLIISCNSRPTIKVKLEDCSEAIQKDHIVILVPLRCQIEKIVQNTDTFYRSNQQSLDIGFDFEVKRGDKIELFWNSYHLQIDDFRFEYKYLFISNISAKTLLLDYRCTDIVID